MDILKIKDLCFSYDGEKEALHNVSFTIKEGQYVAILGHNGSGKSTLAKLIIGLLEKKSGEIVFCDEEITSKNILKIRNRIGIVFQNPDNQFIGATVRDDIAFGLENRQVPHNQMENIVEEFARKVKMEKFLDQEPSKLSGGQKQRVAIAGALAMKPDMIIFDEATVMLDPKGKQEIRSLILEMRKENPRLTVLSITHDIEEAATSDEVIVLNEGKIYLNGLPHEIFELGEKLVKVGLDRPFIAHLEDALRRCGLDCHAKNIEELVDEICQ